MRPARILIIHNAYQQRGGEDAVVNQEALLLKSRGHHVRTLLRHNNDICQYNSLFLAAETLWSQKSKNRVTDEIADFNPDILHVHNTFPLISPAIYWAASHQGVPVVQTLHNFRLLCAQAMFLRHNKVCEDCLGRLPWRGALRGCYRRSKKLSSLLVAMLLLHRILGTYRRKVTYYIALNEFCRRKLVQGGLPANRMAVKPNFIDVARSADRSRRGYLYVGRLSPEKGISTLAEAARKVTETNLMVIGEGTDSGGLDKIPQVEMKGYMKPKQVLAAMARATFLVMPSLWYENFPRTLVEAFACGLPVIASRGGALAELVSDGKTGLLFEPGSSEDLARKIRWALNHRDIIRDMGRAARAEYEAKYTPAINYQQLMSIYAAALDGKKIDAT